MNHRLHRVLDGVAAAGLLAFLALEHVLRVDTIPEGVMAGGDAALHVLIFGALAWHLIKERFNGSKDCHDH